LYLVHDGNDWVFFHDDPALEGFSGEVESDIDFYFPEDVYDWPDGAAAPKVCLGASKANPKLYKVFRSPEDCQQSGYRKVVQDAPKVHDRWSDYVLDKIQHALMPEHAKEILAINLESGEYVLGPTSSKASHAFQARWPNKSMYICRVDGGPAVKFHRR